MASKEEKSEIKMILKSVFTSEDNVSFFFLKKSKITSEFEFLIPYKTKKKSSVEKVYSLKNKYLDDLDVPWKFIQWSKFVGSVVSESKVYKVPFLNTQDINIKNPWRVCPVGEHWVRRHPKELSSGKMTDHDGHCRRNPSKKNLLKGDEMELISKSTLFMNPKIKVSKNNLNMPLIAIEKQNKYDELISGWTAFWNDVFQLKKPLHPNYVKALIATESTFNPQAKAPNPKPIGLARGLMQITEQTARNAKDYKSRDYRDHYVDLEYEELWDANKNIAFGVRHLFRKRETAKAKLKREPSWLEVLMDYKGRLQSKTLKTKEVKDKLKNLIKKLEEK